MINERQTDVKKKLLNMRPDYHFHVQLISFDKPS